MVGLVLLVLLTIAVVAIPQHFNAQRALNRHSQDLLVATIAEAQENAKAFLQVAEDAALLTRGLLATRVLSVEDDTTLEQYFIEQIRLHSQIDGIYLGRPDGSFVFAKREDGSDGSTTVTKFIEMTNQSRRVHRIWRDASGVVTKKADDPGDRYDPRARPWYARALEATGSVWTDPYVFFTSGRPGLTVVANVAGPDGETEAVVGVDMDLRALSTFLQSQFEGEDGAAVILSRDGGVVAHSKALQLTREQDDGSLRLATTRELDALTAKAVEDRLVRLDGVEDVVEHYRFKSGGREYIGVFTPFLDQDQFPWTMGVYSPSAQLTGTLRSEQKNNIVWAIVIAALLSLAALMLAPRILRPIEQRLARAVEDPLTGLMNRRSFLEVANADFARCYRSAQPISAIMLDIDKFKLINDQHGHQVGDEVLTAVSGRLRNALSESDRLSRYGGDEFSIVLPDTTFAAAIEVARRLHKSVQEKPIETDGYSLPISISAGVAIAGGAVSSLEELLDEADQRLLIAKRAGRNQVVFDEIESTLSLVT